MTPARPWFLVLAGLYAATAGACVWLGWFDVALACVVGAVGSLTVWGGR